MAGRAVGRERERAGRDGDDERGRAGGAGDAAAARREEGVEPLGEVPEQPAARQQHQRPPLGAPGAAGDAGAQMPADAARAVAPAVGAGEDRADVGAVGLARAGVGLERRAGVADRLAGGAGAWSRARARSRRS